MRRILITAAGGGASNNLIRALRAIPEPMFLVGTNIDRFYLARSAADRNYLVPRADAGLAYVEAIRAIVRREAVDLVIANNDAEVGPLGRHRADLGARTFLPADRAIELAQDKLSLSRVLAAKGVPVAPAHPIDRLEDVDEVFDRLGRPERLWCRLRRGSASRGALPVATPGQARAWISYWQDMRGVPASLFSLCEYLPGRDFAFQSLWHRGRLVIAKTCERLSYLCGDWMPSGQTSTPRVARLVTVPAVDDVGVRAVQAADPEANGMFCIDLKEDRRGVPCVTEINIGRFFMISPAMNLVGRHNMAHLFVALAFGEAVEVPEAERFSDIGTQETFLIRELDGEPALVTASTLARCAADPTESAAEPFREEG